jgi:hypothetical protein
MIPTDPSMRRKFGFRCRFRMNRGQRGFLPLRRALFHRRLRSLIRAGKIEAARGILSEMVLWLAVAVVYLAVGAWRLSLFFATQFATDDVRWFYYH